MHETLLKMCNQSRITIQYKSDVKDVEKTPNGVVAFIVNKSPVYGDVVSTANDFARNFLTLSPWSSSRQMAVTATYERPSLKRSLR